MDAPVPESEPSDIGEPSPEKPKTVRLLKHEQYWVMTRADFKSDRHFALGKYFSKRLPMHLLKSEAEAKKWIIMMADLAHEGLFPHIKTPDDVEGFITLVLGKSPILTGDKKVIKVKEFYQTDIKRLADHLSDLQKDRKKNSSELTSIMTKIKTVEKEFAELWTKVSKEIKEARDTDEKAHQQQLEEEAAIKADLEAQVENRLQMLDTQAQNASNDAEEANEAVGQAQKAVEEATAKAKDLARKTSRTNGKAPTVQAVQAAKTAQKEKEAAENAFAKAKEFARKALEAKVNALIKLKLFRKERKKAAAYQERAKKRAETRAAKAKKTADMALAAQLEEESKKYPPQRQFRISRDFEQDFLELNKVERAELDAQWRDAKNGKLDKAAVTNKWKLTHPHSIGINKKPSSQKNKTAAVSKKGAAKPKGVVKKGAAKPKSVAKKGAAKPKGVAKKGAAKPKGVAKSPAAKSKKANESETKKQGKVAKPPVSGKKKKFQEETAGAPKKKPKQNDKSSPTQDAVETLADSTQVLEPLPSEASVPLPSTAPSTSGSFARKLVEVDTTNAKKKKEKILKQKQKKEDDIQKEDIAGCHKVELITSRVNQLLIDRAIICLLDTYNLCRKFFYDARFHPIMSRMNNDDLTDFLQ